MTRIYMTLAAVSAIAVAAPLAAQPWQGEGSASRSWHGDGENSGQLQARFDAGVQSGAISRREAMPLRAQLRQLAQMERQYSRAGFNRWERNALRNRSRTLNMNLSAAEQSGDRRFERGDRFSADTLRERAIDRKDDVAMNGRDGHRGDRFAGDLRVGQHFSNRPVALPIEYRDRYRDSDAAYYSYGDNRIYQIDRTSGLILAMYDIGG